ncbi:MAG: acyl-CoA dehydrogenase family protein [Alkalilacustris sp.]
MAQAPDPATDTTAAEMVADTARKLFAGHATAAFEAALADRTDRTAPWLADLWAEMEALGFPLALLDEDHGGFGLDPSSALGLVREAASHALSPPLGETMLANLVLARGGLAPADGPAGVVVVPEVRRDGDGWRVAANVEGVAWGRHLRTLVVCDDAGRIARLGTGWQTTAGQNLAGEPRDRLRIDTTLGEDATAATDFGPDLMEALGALNRAQAIAGALEGMLHRTIAYAGDRVQFGRPLSRFQAIQHSIAVMAANTAAARAGADMAAAALPRITADPGLFRRAVAAAKLRAGEAASLCAPLAHQVHGAIGITREYPLHPLTNRVWAWRDEYGTEADWADRLGAEALGAGQRGYWSFLADSEGDIR